MSALQLLVAVAADAAAGAALATGACEAHQTHGLLQRTDQCCARSHAHAPRSPAAGIVKALCEAIAKSCPKAWVAIISNPVNSTVPIAAEVFKRCAGRAHTRLCMGEACAQALGHAGQAAATGTARVVPRHVVHDLLLMGMCKGLTR